MPSHASIVALALLVACGEAAALTRRPQFEPTDLDIDAPGVLDLDLQFGLVRTGRGLHAFAPDLEIDLGIAPGFELDLDGTFMLASGPGGVFPLDTPQYDNLWVSTKVMMFDWADTDRHRALAIGLQQGARLPVSTAGRGVGFEALLLVGVALPRMRLTLNLGGVADPASEDSPPTNALLSGLNASFDMDSKGLLTLECAGLVAWSPGRPTDAAVTFGLTYAATQWLDLSITGLTGYLDGGAAYGLLLGISPQIRLWSGR